MFKRQSIKVAVANGYELVGAMVLGSLAVHKPLEGGGYVVTHVPSGYKLADAWKQKNCKALVRELDALGIDWNIDPRNTSEEFSQQALPLIREFISNPNN